MKKILGSVSALVAIAMTLPAFGFGIMNLSSVNEKKIENIKACKSIDGNSRGTDCILVAQNITLYAPRGAGFSIRSLVISPYNYNIGTPKTENYKYIEYTLGGNTYTFKNEMCEVFIRDDAQMQANYECKL